MISRRFQKCPSNQRICAVCLEPRANEHNILGQQFATLLDVTRCTPCCMLLRVVGSYCAKFENGQTFQPATPTFSFFVS